MRTIDIIKSTYSDKCVGSLAAALKEKGIATSYSDYIKNDAEAVLLAGAHRTSSRFLSETDSYLKNGGKMILLGSPCFSQELFLTENGEADISEISRIFTNGGFFARPLVDLSKENEKSSFYADTYNPDSKKVDITARLELIKEANGENALKYHTDDFYINESFETKISFEKGENAICFFAKADSNTKTITISLVDNDGAIFKTTVAPSEEYRHFILTKRDFFYGGSRNPDINWHNRPNSIDFSKVCFLQIGHTLSHAYSVAGKHEFFIKRIETGKIDVIDDNKYSIDGVYPEYKFYPVTNAATLLPDKNSLLKSAFSDIPASFPSIHPRAQGSGFNKGRRYRFCPIISAYDSQGLLCGYAAYAIYNHSYRELKAPHNNSSILVFTPDSEDFYKNNAEAISDIISRFLCPVRLIEGGADQYIYRDDDKAAEYGFVVSSDKYANISEYSVELSINGNITKFNLSDAERFCENEQLAFYRAHIFKEACEGEASATLFCKGRAIDRISHNVALHCLKPKDQRKYAYIKPNENEIYIDNKPVRFFGVNYMPSVCGGLEYGYEFEHYVSAEAYDPDIIENDIRRIKDIGINALSIFFYHKPSLKSNNILHLLWLCEKYGLFVNLSLRPNANPFDYSKSEVRQMIERFRLDAIDTVVGYDIAWERYVGTYEPCYGNFNGRKYFDSGFREYLINRYGSVENAQKLTDYTFLKDENGLVRGPSDDMLRQDGPHNGYVAIFRKYIDNAVALAHIKACEHIKSIDQNHLVSARSGDASTIPLVDPGIYGYDYKAMSMGCDYVSPESYALSDNEKSMRQGVFTNIYARYANPNNVVQWMEFGKSIWIGSNFSDNSLSKKWQAEYYRNFFDMLIKGHTSGLFAWWWTGGYRIGENSDFGIVNPDGSDRPVTMVFREYADKFKNAPKLKPPSVKIKINRELHADGLRSVYLAAEKELFAAIESNKTVILYDEGYQKTSADVSIAETGGYSPSGFSPNYLDGFIVSVALQSGNTAAEISNNSAVMQNAGSVIKIRYINSEKSIWKKQGGYGGVSLKSDEFACPLQGDLQPNSFAVFTLPTDKLSKGTHTFSLTAENRTPFGERFVVTII